MKRILSWLRSKPTKRAPPVARQPKAFDARPLQAAIDRHAAALDRNSSALLAAAEKLSVCRIALPNPVHVRLDNMTLAADLEGVSERAHRRLDDVASRFERAARPRVNGKAAKGPAE